MIVRRDSHASSMQFMEGSFKFNFILNRVNPNISEVFKRQPSDFKRHKRHMKCKRIILIDMLCYSVEAGIVKLANNNSDLYRLSEPRQVI